MIIHFFCAAAIIALVLLQRGKGAEAGAGFGAGASGTVFGARGASTALSRATAILAAIFMVTSLSLAYVGTRKSAAPSGVLDQFSQPAAPVAPAVPTPQVIQIPPAAPATTAPANAPPPAANTPPPANSPAPK